MKRTYELRIFGTKKEMNDDFAKHPLYAGDVATNSHNRPHIVNDIVNREVLWACEECADIPMLIQGIELRSLFMSNTVSWDSGRYAVMRLR